MNSIFYQFIVLQQFNKLKQEFTAIEIENRDDCADIQAALGQLTGATSVNLINKSLSQTNKNIK